MKYKITSKNVPVEDSVKVIFDTDTYTILGVNDSSVSFLWCRA